MSTLVPGVNTDEKSNDGGSTPTIVTGALLMVSAEPTMSSLPPNRRCQTACVRSAVRGPAAAPGAALAL